jgi:hypothetical protein
MLIRKFITTVALASAVLVPAVSGATPTESPCILSGHNVLAVEPLKIDEHYGRNVVTRLRGAQVYIQAEPGLTAEWLQLSLQRHAAAMKGAMPNCAFDLSGVRVDVASNGPGFWVRLVAPDTKSGEEVLRRAELLVH